MAHFSASSGLASVESTAVRQPVSATWKSPLLVWPALILLGVALAGTNRVGARQEEEHPASFVKIGKNYINVDKVSHIFDDPGQPLPPGSISICFSGGSQDYMNLYNEDATTFRELISKMTSDLTPKSSAETATKKAVIKKAAAPATPKKPALPPPPE